MDMGREAVEFSANGEEEKLLSFGMKLVEYDMVTLHEGRHARMEEAEPAMEDGVLCRKEEWLLIVEYDMLTLDVEYDMVTLDEGGHARMEEAEPAMEDGVLCRKEEWLLIVEYDMLTLDEGELARMEVVNPATEDVPLPFKEYVIQ